MVIELLCGFHLLFCLLVFLVLINIFNRRSIYLSSFCGIMINETGNLFSVEKIRTLKKKRCKKRKDLITKLYR